MRMRTPPRSSGQASGAGAPRTRCIHVAAALSLSPLDGFLTYDERQGLLRAWRGCEPCRLALERVQEKHGRWAFALASPLGLLSHNPSRRPGRTSSLQLSLQRRNVFGDELLQFRQFSREQLRRDGVLLLVRTGGRA